MTEQTSRRGFLQALFGDFLSKFNGFVLVKSVSRLAGVARTFYFPDIDLLETEEFEEDAELFFGVCPIQLSASSGRRTRYLTALWAEMYIGHSGHEPKSTVFDSPDDAANTIRSFQHKPSAIVDSGHSKDLYWLLKEPYHPEDSQEVRRVLQAISSVLNCDADVSLDAVLRLPGTQNRKFPDRPAVCKIDYVDASARYSLQDFEMFQTNGRPARSSLETMTLPADKGRAGAQGSVGSRDEEAVSPMASRFLSCSASPGESSSGRILAHLLSEGVLPTDRINALREYQQAHGCSEVEAIIGLTHEVVADVAREVSGVPRIRLEAHDCPLEIQEKLPLDLAFKWMAVAFGEVGRTLHVAMADPTDAEAVKEIESATGMSVKVSVATVLEIKSELESRQRALVRAAEQGDRDAAYLWGRLLLDGAGLFRRRDPRAAANWFLQAARQGHPDAQNSLGLILSEGKEGSREDGEAVKWYRRAAGRGHVDACFNLGIMYCRGRGVRKDLERGAEWIGSAAEQGHARAQFVLGSLHQSGAGVEMDLEEAVKWYRLSAEQGYAAAENRLGFMYGHALGVPLDHQEAFKWYRRAAEHGHRVAQRRLSEMYRQGVGVQPNTEEADRWERQAKVGADPEAAANAQAESEDRYGFAPGPQVHYPIHFPFASAEARGERERAPGNLNVLLMEEIVDGQDGEYDLESQPQLTEPRPDKRSKGSDDVRSAETTLTHPMRSHVEPDLDMTYWKVGDVVDGKYEVRGIIGRGGMGVVYRVHHREWNVEMAVKVPLSSFISDEVAKARFVREAQTWVDLGLHPNIVQCWYVREIAGLPRIFMDYMDGGSLKQWVQQGRVKPTQWEKIIDLTVQACDGLHYAHERGLVHRDVKPSNMLMAYDGRLAMADFGIVKIEGFGDLPSPALSDGRLPQHTLTRTGSTMGTPEYAAPEMWQDARIVDQRADIYSLGVVLFELSCGRRPFDDGLHREPPHVLIERHVCASVPDPRALEKAVPASMAELILDCLAKKPDERPESVAVLRERLNALFEATAGRDYPRAVPSGAQLRADALNNRGVSLWELGHHKRAFQAWDEAVRLDANHAEALYNRSLIEWREAKVTDAQVVRRLSQMSNSNPYGRLYLGYVHLERLAAHLAEREIDGALQHSSVRKEMTAWLALGDARMAQGKIALAEECYRQLLSLGYPEREIEEKRLLAGSHPDSPVEFNQTSWLRCVSKLELGRPSGAACVAVTPDSQFVLAGSLGGTIKMLRLPSGGEVRMLEGHEGAVNSLAVTPNGEYVVSGGVDHTVRLWRLSTGECVQTFGTISTPLKRIRFRHFLATGVDSGSRGIGRRWPGLRYSRSVQSVSTDPFGSAVAAGSYDGSVCLWDLKTGKCRRTYGGHSGQVNSVCITNDGRFLVSAGWDRTIRVWDLDTGKCLHEFLSEVEVTNDLAVRPDGKLIVSGTAENVIRVWDVSTENCSRELLGHTAPVRSVAVTPDGTRVVSGGEDGTVRVWELATGRCLRTLEGHRRPVECVCITPDGRYAISGGQEHSLRLWTLPLTADLPRSALQINRAAEYGSAHTTAGRFNEHFDAALEAFNDEDPVSSYQHLNQARLLQGYERDPKALALQAKLVRKLPAATLRGGWQAGIIESPHPVISLATDGQGTSLLTGHTDRICQWDLSRGTTRMTLEGHSEIVSAVTFIKSDRQALSASWDGTLRLWDLSSGECLRTMSEHANVVSALSIGEEGRFALSGGWDHTLRLWHVETGECLRTFGGESRWIVAVSVVPGDKLALSGGWDNVLRIWNLGTGECMQALSGHRSWIGGIRVTQDGRFALTGSGDHTLCLWDLSKGKCLRKLSGHGGGVGTVSVTDDGRFACSGSTDGSVKVWDLVTGECLWTFEGHGDAVNAVAFMPDGCSIASGSSDGTLRIWQLDWELATDGGVKQLTEQYEIDCDESLVTIYGIDPEKTLSQLYGVSD